jgi:asparagine synthase (glutamine-hydrolysing)
MPSKLFGYAGAWPGAAAQARLHEARASLGIDRPAVVLSAHNGFGGFLSGEFIAEGDGAAVALIGTPAWTDEQAAAPGNPASRVLARYREHGLQFVDRMRGRFALALVDTQARTALLALDPMGMERLTYSASAEGLVFSDSASAVRRFPGVDGDLRSQSVYDYLLLHIVPAPDTIYRGVSKLRPGIAATYRNGQLTTRRYWQPAFVEHSTQSFGDLKLELHSSLERAVRAENPDDSTGAFLSGGLDSSSVAGVLSKVRPGNARTFSMGFGVDAYDELEYARIASRHFGVRSCEYHVTPEDIVDAFPRIAAAYDEPFGNSSAVPTYVCARTAAQNGITHLLAGDGGDELFGGNERYVRQGVFEKYFAIPGLLRAGILEPLTRCISPESGITPLRKLRSYVDQARIRLPERLETWNLMYREGAVNILDEDFRATIDARAPFRRMQEVFDEIPGASMLNRMLFYDWHYTLSDNDLRKVGAMCELAGVRVSYPMLHRDVVDLSLRVPSALKIEGVELRSFYKKAMADFLPAQIIRKEKHGFGLPFGVWLKTHRGLAELIFAHLDSLRRRRIVRAAFIDDIVSRHRTGDASFYGYPIWDMAMLDAWMTAHGVT